MPPQAFPSLPNRRWELEALKAFARGLGLEPKKILIQSEFAEPHRICATTERAVIRFQILYQRRHQIDHWPKALFVASHDPTVYIPISASPSGILENNRIAYPSIA